MRILQAESERSIKLTNQQTFATSVDGTKVMSENGGIIGVSDHGGWAVLVTVARDGTLLDRRRVELVDESLPSLPHHHEGQLLATNAAVDLVERVRASAERRAVVALDAVAMAVPHILGIALRTCPQLPATIAERINDYRARNVADWVMYRKALAFAAEARGWPIHLQLRRTVGPPWNNDHKLAMAAAIVTASVGSQ
jgi:hypothetical protein